MLKPQVEVVLKLNSQVDVQVLRAFICKKVPGRTVGHHMLNDIVWRDLTFAGIPASKEPVDGKRPDGLILIPGRQAIDLGCHGCQHFGHLLRAVGRQGCRFCCRVGG